MVRFVREQLGRLAPCFVASALIALASCSSNSTPTGQPASSVSRALPAAGSELIFPPFAGFSGNLIVPTNDAAASTNVKLASYNLQPSRAPFPQSATREIGAELHRAATTPGGGTVIFWESLSFTQAVNFDTYPMTSFTLPGSMSPSTTGFSLEMLDGNSGALLNEWTGPTIVGQTLTFAASSGPGLQAVTGDTYWLELISTPFVGPTATPSGPTPTPSGPTPTPSPSVAPTATPTPSPSPSGPTPTPSPTPASPIVLSPTAGVVGNNSGCSGAPASYTFTATEAGYSGVLTATAPSFAPHPQQFTVSPASVSSGGTFTVTDSNPTEALGIWNVTVTDTLGNSAIESVTSAVCLP